MSEEPARAEPGTASGHRLAHSRSIYLRGAQDQAIEWYPWGVEPFELARRTHRPVLLDVGAAWCHWCHVMDEGTYSDAEVARILHQGFVAVKVDRDEHPEVDRRYQREVGTLTGEGGWPLTAFLNPDGEVFFGGTYFPPQDGLGKPGFRRVLKEVARWWKEEPERVRAYAQQIRDGLGRMTGRDPSAPASSSAFTDAVRRSLYSSYDPVHGGFGMAPKFPHPTAISFLLWDAFAAGNEASAARARETLLRMADGGVYDHLGGGFHRYSVDEGWHIPHFEKMGNDNAALLAAYAEGVRRFADTRLAEAVRGTLDWVRTSLEQKGGGFGSSQDADNAPGDDGGYYTWSRAELKAVLEPDELRIVSRVFGIGTDGRMPHDPDRNVLYHLMTASEAAEGGTIAAAESVLARAQEKLREARAKRPAPPVDPAIYAQLNGEFVRSFVSAARWLHDSGTERAARAAADRFLAHAYAKEHGVAHRLDGAQGHGYGLLEDQAQFAWGLVELAGATLDRRYFSAAEELLELIDREFAGTDGLRSDFAPRLYDGPKIGSIREPSYPLEDSPHLSANSATALAYLRFASLSGRTEWHEKAVRLLEPIRTRIGQAGLFASGAALAAGIASTPAARVVVEGDGPDAEALYRAATLGWHPNAWVFRGVPPEPFSSPEELKSVAGAGSARALLCFGDHCLAPVTVPDQIRPLLLSGGRSAPP